MTVADIEAGDHTAPDPYALLVLARIGDFLTESALGLAASGISDRCCRSKSFGKLADGRLWESSAPPLLTGSVASCAPS